MKVKELEEFENRLVQVEIALSHLMQVVANQDELLPDFAKNIEYATKMTDETSKLIDLYPMDDGAEA
tara:strand:+ start:207 stop:407 length:201 start_codon:yes stop_codon:yes gene_type:complete